MERKEDVNMRVRCLLLCLLGALLCDGARAQLVLTLDQSQFTALPGDTVTFTGNLTNNNPFETFLNGAEFPQIDPGLAGDESPFFVNTPLSLAPGASLPNPVTLFTVTLDPGLLPGSYSGAFRVVGGPDDQTFDPLAEVPFRVNVAAPTGGGVIPEPSSLALAGIGLLPLAGTLRRRKAG